MGQEKKVLRLFKLSRDLHETRQDTVETDTNELEMWVEWFSSIFWFHYLSDTHTKHLFWCDEHLTATVMRFLCKRWDENINEHKQEEQSQIKPLLILRDEGKESLRHTVQWAGIYSPYQQLSVSN